MSNHFGGVGGGHYTAYGKNPIDGQWYDFDDSYVQAQGSNQRRGRGSIVTGAAYNLFFRMRTDETMDTLNLDRLAQHPDMEFLNSVRNAAK